MGSYGIVIKKLALQNLSAIYFSESSMEDDYQIRGNPGMLKIFLAIALLILILTSINYVNYTISMQFNKLKEIGIHKTHGSSHRKLAGGIDYRSFFGCTHILADLKFFTLASNSLQ